MNKNIALCLLLPGAAIAIGAFNPFFGEPNLHPNPFVVFGGAALACVGAYLFGFRVEPRLPRARAISLIMILVFVLLSLATLIP